MKAKTPTGIALATAAALLFGKAVVQPVSATESTLSCFGVNTCKGQSACKSASNDCKGQNACKGRGFVELTKEDCAAAKQKVKKVVKQ